MITKSQFNEWRNTEVTQAMFEEVREVIETVASEMLVRRNSDPQDDQYLKGYIRGIQAGMEWVPEFPPEDEEEANG
jgi:hypothetical protein